MTRRARVAVVLASVLLFLSSLLWAVLTPAFRGPDEPAHLNSVVRVAGGGGWPAPGTIRYEDEVRDAQELSGAVHDGVRTSFPRTADALPELPAFPDLTPTPPADRASLHELDDGPSPGGPADQMTQHPPGPYAVAAVVYRLTGAEDWRYDRALLLMRALTALIVASTLPVCCFVAARQLTGSESVGVLASFVPLVVPQVSYISGTVTNDGATVATTAAVWALLITVLCSGPTRRRLLLLALALGAACWTKGTALSLLPSIVLAVAIGYRRSRGPRLRSWAPPALGAAAGVLGLGAVMGGWWWMVNLVRYGGLQPSGYELRPGEFETFGLAEFLGVFVRRIRWNFFGEVGGREPPLLDVLTAVLAVAFAALCVAGLVALRRAGDRAVVLLGAATTVGLLVHTTYTAHLATNNLPGIQGRYLFVLLVPIAVLVAAGLARLLAAVGVPAVWYLPVVAATAAGVTATGLALALLVFYAGPDDSWTEGAGLFLGWAAVPAPAVAALLAAFLLAAAALVRVSARGEPAGPPITPTPRPKVREAA